MLVIRQLPLSAGQHQHLNEYLVSIPEFVYDCALSWYDTHRDRQNDIPYAAADSGIGSSPWAWYTNAWGTAGPTLVYMPCIMLPGWHCACHDD